MRLFRRSIFCSERDCQFTFIITWNLCGERESETERYYSSSFNETFERGSPSLAGRGIANPMSERTRGFESHSPRCILELYRWRRTASTVYIVTYEPL